MLSRLCMFFFCSLIDQMDTFLSNIFSVQIATSGICICCSIYCLVFVCIALSVFFFGSNHQPCKLLQDLGENPMEQLIFVCILIFNVFDIFMIMLFGNKIKLSSEQLPYCLFQSNWIVQPQSCKKNILIFAELLRTPHELVALKLYPLTLETFTMVRTLFDILWYFEALKIVSFTDHKLCLRHV